MAPRRTKATKEQARTLLEWLKTLTLPTRAINALSRDLEAILGLNTAGRGVLEDVGQALFIEELYRPGGGTVGRVPGVAAGAIEALRAAIPAQATSDGTEAVGAAQAEQEPAASADGAPEDTEAAQAAQGEAATNPAAEEVPVPTAAAQEAQLEVAAPEVADNSAATTGVTPVLEKTSDVTVAEAAPEPGYTPRRRGRPRSASASAAGDTARSAPAEALAAPAQRRGRRPREEAAPATPAAPVATSVQRPAPVAATLQAAPLISTVQQEPGSAAPAMDQSFEVLLQLWRELHPRGQRATLHYMSELLGMA